MNTIILIIVRLVKKPVDANYSALTEETELSHKVPKFKFGHRVMITKYNNIFSKSYAENWSREIFVIDSALKINPWTYKMKDLNGEKIIGSFYDFFYYFNSHKSIQHR